MDYVEHLIVHRLDLILYDKVYGLFTNYDIRWGQGGSLAKVGKSWQGGSGGSIKSSIKHWLHIMYSKIFLIINQYFLQLKFHRIIYLFTQTNTF